MLDDKVPLKGMSAHWREQDSWRGLSDCWATVYPEPGSHLSYTQIAEADSSRLHPDCRFQTEAPNVVHMTVKPQEVVDEEDGKTGKAGIRRDGEDEVHAGCRCVIL